MNDLELTERESDRLRELLHRRADHIQVTTPEFDVVTPTQEAHRRGNGRWFAAAAAAVVVLAAVGGAWWLSSDGTDRIDTVPAEPAVTVAPQVLEQSGIWRLPDPTSDLEVLGAQEGGSRPAALLAVDDPDDPSRWIMIGDYGVQGEASGARTVDAADGMVIVLSSNDRSETPRFGMRDGDSSEYVSGLYQGVDDEEIVEMLRRTFPDRATLIEQEFRSVALAALAPPDGLVPTWDPEVVIRTSDANSADSIELSLRADLDVGDDAEVVVSMTQLGLPPAVTALLLRLQSEQMQLRLPETGALVSQELVERPELGDRVYELRYVADDEVAAPGARLVVLTDDGVMIGVTQAVESTEVATARPASASSQLGIINRLRSTDRSDFVARLEAQGVEFFAAGSVRTDGDPTTTVDSSEGP